MIVRSALVVLFAVVFDQARLSAQETQSGGMRLYPPTTIEWKPGPAALPPGAKMAALEGDPTKEGPFVVRFQFPDGYHVAPHTHPKTERVTVISGTLLLAIGEALDRSSAKKLPAGSFGYWARRHETHGVVRRRDCDSTPWDRPVADQLCGSRRRSEERKEIRSRSCRGELQSLR